MTLTFSSTCMYAQVWTLKTRRHYGPHILKHVLFPHAWMRIFNTTQCHQPNIPSAHFGHLHLYRCIYPALMAVVPKNAQVISVCKSADLLLMVLDATKPWGHKEILTRELESVGIRLNRYVQSSVLCVVQYVMYIIHIRGLASSQTTLAWCLSEQRPKARCANTPWSFSTYSVQQFYS